MRRKLLIMCLTLVMSLNVYINHVYAASDKVLSINWNHIQEVGNQKENSVSCACFTMAYCRTILDKKVHYWHEYNYNKDKNQFNALAQWSLANYNSKYVSTKQEAYKAAYDSINNGRPIVFRVLGKYQHYITIIGYSNVTDPNKLDASNFLIIDSIPNSTKKEVTNMKKAGYSLYYSGGYRYIYTTKGSINTYNPVREDTVFTINHSLFPTTIIKGSQFISKATISSNNAMSKVSVKIYDKSSSKYIQTVSSSVTTTKFDISKLAKSIDFASLDKGTYKYIVEVTDKYSDKFKVVNKEFNVNSILPFKDINQYEWYAKMIDQVYTYGLMSGTNETSFNPNLNMTRGMVATVLYRIEGSPKQIFKQLFSDVYSNQYYASSVTWAKQTGIMNGYSNNSFKPEQSITREEVITTLYNYIKYKQKYKLSDIELTQYNDYKHISSYAKEPMKWAIANKIVSGKNSGKNLDPKGTATRAECSKMLVAIYEYINK